MTTATHMAMGYRATKTDDSLIIHHVPIFCACSRGDDEFNDVWVKKAVANAMQQQRDNYMPPLHIRHHEESTEANDSVRAVGFFRITGAEPITLKAERRIAVMADLVITDEWAQEQILSMRLPYRSVEIFNVDNAPSIDGMALLDHEAPFFELPMLTVSNKDELQDQGSTFRRSWTMESLDDGGPVVGSLRQGKKATLLFRSQENDMPEEEKTVAEVINDKVQATRFAEDDKPKDDEKKDNKDGENMEEGALDVSSVVKAIESGEISIADMDAILAAIQGQGAEKEPEPEAEELAPAAAPGAEAMKKGNAMSEQFAKVSGEAAALKIRLDERDAADVRKDDVAEAMQRLEGRPLGANFKDELTAFHKAYGAESFKTHVDTIAKTIGIMPDDKSVDFRGANGKVPEVAMKYQDQGPDAVTMAMKFAGEWESLRSTGISTTQENYIKHNMERATANA